MQLKLKLQKFLVEFYRCDIKMSTFALKCNKSKKLDYKISKNG